MTDYLAPSAVDALIHRLERSSDLDLAPFRRMSKEQQDQETRYVALRDPRLAWEQFVEYVEPKKFMEAWRKGDAIHMLLLMDEALREGLEDEINDFYREAEHE